MLDISIPRISKEIKTNSAAKEFCNQYVSVEEKLDGTKLTFIRNDTPFDENDYLKNWIISYKEGVVFPEEFSGLDTAGRREEIKTQSGGRSQYAFIHEHLRRVHPNTSDFPLDYEFFIEFIQRKPTVSRSYEKTGGLFLTGFGPTVYSLKGSRVTSLASFENNAQKKEYFREALELEKYPVIFEGRLDSSESIIDGSKNSRIRTTFESHQTEIDEFISQNNWQAVLDIIVEVFSNFTSALGGEAEGVVVSPLPDPDTNQTTRFTGRLFKASHPLQLDDEERRKKKREEFGEGTPEEESIYHGNISKFIRSKIEENDLDDEPVQSALDFLAKIIYKMSEEDFASIGVENPKKKLIQFQEDAISAAGNILGKRFAVRSKKGRGRINIGVIPMAVKPIHMGHWSVIEQAAEDNKDGRVFLIVSGKSRDKGGTEISGSDMIKIWKRYLEPILPPNVDISYSESPLQDSKGVIRAYANEPNVYFKLYAGEDDADRFTEEKLMNDYPVQYAAGRLEPVIVKNVPLPGGESGRIKGTYMRGLLTNGSKDEFISLLPDKLSEKDKDEIWDILYKKPAVSESVLRLHIRECLILS